MGYLERGLRRLAEFQKSHSIPILVVVLIFTSFMFVGATSVTVESDFNKELPQDLDIIVLNNRINDKFSGQDTSFILLTLDDETNFRGDQLPHHRIITSIQWVNWDTHRARMRFCWIPFMAMNYP